MDSKPPRVHGIFHQGSSTMTYVVTDPNSLATAILDSVLDYDAPSGRTSNEHNEKVAEYCRVNSLDVRYILETHVHGAFEASFVSGHQFYSVICPSLTSLPTSSSRPPHGGGVPEGTVSRREDRDRVQDHRGPGNLLVRFQPLRPSCGRVPIRRAV